MALLDVLRERAARKGGTAQVECGALGTLTVEALSVAECARLAKSPRGLLYAACRELQAAGAALLEEKKVFRPEEITEHISDEEAAAAARVILELSGNPPAPEDAGEDTPEPAVLSETVDTAPPSQESPGAEDITGAGAALSGEETDAPVLSLPLSPSAAFRSGAPAAKTAAAAALRAEIPASGGAQRPLRQSSAPFTPSDAFPVRGEGASAEDGFSLQGQSSRPAQKPCLSPEERAEVAQEAAKILADELRRAAMVR